MNPIAEGLRALILEDVPTDAELELREMRAGGLVVDALRVETEDDFVRGLEEFRPDFVLVDYKLPTFDGMSALRLASQRSPHVPVIVVTGSLDEETAVDCFKAGAADYVLKSQLGRLVPAIRSALERRQAQEREQRVLEALRADEARLNALLDLSQRAEAMNEGEILELGLEKALGLTASPFGYLHLVGEDQRTVELSIWSEQRPDGYALRHRAGYRLDEAGAWVDFAARGGPTVRNAPGALPGPAGQPEPGSPLVRHASVPVREDGKLRLVLGVGSKASDYDDGDIRQLSLVAGALTRLARRKRAELQLQREKERLQAIIDNIPVMVAFYDADHRGVLVNREFERVMGWSQAQAGTIDLVSTCYPDPEEQARVRAHIEQADRSWREYRARAQDGRLLHTRWANVRLADDTRLGFGEDITERKAAEGRLRRLSRVVEQSPIMVVITDTTAHIEYVNARFSEVTGYSFDEVRGQNPRLLKSGETSPDGYRALWQRLAAGEPWEGEFHNRRKDGTLYWERALITPLHDLDGRLTHYVALKEDITREKAQNEALRHAQAQFLQAQKMEAVGRLAGGVAHDFNNLLGVIGGYAEVLLTRGTDDEQRKRIEQILRASERAAGLTRQLLAFSRQQVLEPRVVDLGTLLTESEGMLRRLLGEDIELDVRRESPLGRVRVDPTQIQQVLLNLVVNARDAMPTGGSLWIKLSDIDLDRSYAAVHEPVQPGSYVLLSVSDTGVGMDRETQARVFEPFFTTKEEGKGTGLGLSTVYGIVKQSGGFIWLYSEPGSGTTFKIYLPRVDQEPSTEAAGAPVEARGGHESILLVEDEGALSTIVAEMLGSHGYRVLSASDGPAAIAMVQGGAAVDLLLTDMVMPGMSGRRLADEVRALRPSLRVLFMSGYSHEIVARHGVLQRGERLLQKPFGVVQLLQSVRAALETGQG